MNDSALLFLGVVIYGFVILLAFIINDPSFLFGKEMIAYRQQDSQMDSVPGSDGGWEYLGTSGSALVDTYIKKIESSNLFAFKGAMVVDEHIAVVLKSYADVDTTNNWVDLLKIMETLPVSVENSQQIEPKGLAKISRFFGSVLKSLKGKSNNASKSGQNNNILQDQPYQSIISDLVYQYYTLPWPVAPREFLFRRDIRLHESFKSVTVQYASTEDARHPLPTEERPATSPAGRPISKSVIRAESPFTNWLFQDLRSYCRQQQQQQQGRASSLQEDTASSRLSSRVEKVCVELTETGKSKSNSKSNDEVGRRTVVQIESLVDNKGSLPAWFVNYVQRYTITWPRGFIEYTRKLCILPNYP